MATITYRYAIRAHATLPPEVTEQLRLAHELRACLVDDTLAYDQALRDLWSAQPTVAAIEAQLAVADHAATEFDERARRERAEDRTTVLRPHTAADLRTARDRVKELRAARRQAIQDVYELVKPSIDALRPDRNAATRALYARFVTGCGLYGSTFNAVHAHHQVAVARINRLRKTGQWVALRHRPWDGTGLIAVQVQGTATGPPRTPQRIAEETRRKILRITPWRPPAEFDALPRCDRRRLARTGQVILAIGRGRLVRLPISTHRMIPPTAEITAAQLVVTRSAGRLLAHLCVSVRLDDPAPTQGRTPIAVHGGWRRRDDGSIRVATWAAPRPLNHPPPHLPDWVVIHDDGRWGEIILPARDADIATRTRALQSRRDRIRATIQHDLANWLAHPPSPQYGPAQTTLTSTEVHQWRSARPLIELAQQWRDAPPPGPGGHDMADRLEKWRRRDRHLREWQDNERAQTAARRDDAWRKVSAWLADQAGPILLDDTDYTKIGQRPDLTDNDPVLHPVALRAGRANAMLAAPATLRQFLREAAARRGVTTVTVSRSYLTRTHRECGMTANPDSRYAISAPVTCPNCSLIYDQDRNAAMLMLDAGAVPADARTSPPQRQPPPPDRHDVQIPQQPDNVQLFLFDLVAPE